MIKVSKVELLREHTRLRQLQITLSNGWILKAEQGEWWPCNVENQEFNDTLSVEEHRSVERVITKHRLWLHGGPRPDAEKKDMS